MRSQEYYVHIFASTSVSFRPTSMRVINLALNRTKRITVWESLAGVHWKGGERVVWGDIKSTDVLNNMIIPSNGPHSCNQ
jgi:hypothetical protein